MKRGPYDRLVGVLGVCMAVFGVVTCLTMCHATARQAVGALLGSVITMGYSNGTDAYNGSCRNKPSLLECMSCCAQLTAGMAPGQKGICIDLCLDQWEQQGEDLEDLLIDVAEVVDTGRETDRLTVTSATGILTAARHSARERIARAARGLCKQLRIAEPVQS